MLGRGAPPGKKRASADTRVISAGARKRRGIPGGFGDEDDDEDDEADGDADAEENRRMSKRVRVGEEDGGVDQGKRVSIEPTEKDKRRAEREREATRRMLEAKREKRRSSIRRVSGIAPQIPSEYFRVAASGSELTGVVQINPREPGRGLASCRRRSPLCAMSGTWGQGRRRLHPTRTSRCRRQRQLNPL